MMAKINGYTKTTSGIIIIAGMLICLFVVGCSRKMDPSATYSGIIDVNDENFDEVVLHSRLPVLVYFYSTHCKPSWYKMPRVKILADRTKGKLKVCKAEAATVYVLQSQGIPNPNISQRYRLGGLPTIIIFNEGKEIIRDINGVDPNLYYLDINPVLEKLTGVKF